MVRPRNVPRVLVVDDEPVIGRVIRRILEREYLVVVETDAAAALERIGSGEFFDLVIADVFMPGLTGADLYEVLRRQAPHLAATMVFMTGGTDMPFVTKFLARVANPCLEKPFGVSEMRELVRRQLYGEAVESAAAA